jgi:glycosyltransferase involved in cell wall biosynthesis
MLITIITPSRNQGQYIGHCLESIFTQTHGEIEHIILDGLSTDHTASVVKSYPSSFLQRKDTGPAQAINRGLEMATGEIVCWLNADDAFADREVLARMVAIFMQQPEVDVVTGDGYYIDDAGRLLLPIIPERASRMSYTWMRRSDPFLQPATFWRRNPARLNEALHYTFDWQLWLDFFGAGLNILYAPGYSALYRLQAESLTQQDKPLRRKEIYDIIARNSDSTAQRWWCWIVWRASVLDGRLHTTFLRTGTRIVNQLLHLVTNGKISWG